MITKEMRKRFDARLERARTWNREREAESMRKRKLQQRQQYIGTYQIKPLNESILVEPILEDVKMGNLILPHTQWGESRNCLATVISCGKYVTACKPGDVIAVWHLSGWKYNDQRIIHQELVYGVSEEGVDVR